MKAYINYINWMLLNRNEVRPEVGDKIKVWNKNCFLDHNINNEDLLFFKQNKDHFHLSFVEIDYNPNEVIEFYNFMLQYQDMSCALRLNECETELELLNKWKQSKDEQDDK